MALTNFSLPFGALAQPVQTPWGATISPLHSSVHQLASNTNNLLYAPADHQQQDDGAAPPPESDYYKNNPYAPPQLHQQQQPQQQQSYQYNNNNNNNNNNRYKNGNTYLPPIPPPGVARNTQYQYQAQQLQQQYSHISTQQQQQQQHQPQSHRQQQINNNNNYKTASSTAAAATPRTYGEGTYNRYTTSSQPQQQQQQQNNLPQPQQQQPQPQQKQYYNSYSARASASTSASSSSSSSSKTFNSQQQQQQPHSISQTKSLPNFSSTNIESPIYGAAAVSAAARGGIGGDGGDASPNEAAGVADGADVSAADGGIEDDGSYPVRPPGFTRVQAGTGTRTQVHAVLDYDVEEGEDDEYYDEDDHGEQVNKDGSKKSSMPTVTPIQGPIFLKNGTVPVVPLFSYPTINNGSFVQIPIWWTALSVALGLDVRGDVIKGVPCIKRYHQLFCPTAGNSYPIDKIERFIDDNKALMRRMYGDFEMNMDSGGPRQQTKKRRRRFIDEPDIFIPPGAFPAVMPDADELHPHAEEAGESYFGKLRNKRQSSSGSSGGNQNRGKGGNFANVGQSGSSTGRLDACESKVEIVTPYWASNSAGKIRAIVNTQHFEQAIHQEICSKSQTPRCERDCGCEQKYKWHRLLAYDPDNDCKGIFMDWFLFPSCCVCRCNP